MPRHATSSSRNEESTSSCETTTSSSSDSDDDEDVFRGRRKRRPPKLSLRITLTAVSASVDRAPPHHRDRAALEVAELFSQAYASAKKEVKAELERLAFSFYASPASLPGSLAARRALERAAAGELPEARRKSFLRAVREASIAEKRGGRSARGAEEGGAGAAEAEAAAASTSAADAGDGAENGDSDGSSGGLFPSPELFELVPDVVRHLADFLAPVDALIAAGVCTAWRQALEDAPFWRQKLSRYFGERHAPMLAFEGALEETAAAAASASSSATAATAMTTGSSALSAASRALQPVFERGQGAWIARQLPKEERNGKAKKKEKEKIEEEEGEGGATVGVAARYWRAKPPPPLLLRHHPLSTRFEPDEEEEEDEGDCGPRLVDRGPRDFIRCLPFGGNAPLSSSSSSSSCSSSSDDDGEDVGPSAAPAPAPAAAAAAAAATAATTALRLWNLSGKR